MNYSFLYIGTMVVQWLCNGYKLVSTHASADTNDTMGVDAVMRQFRQLLERGEMSEAIDWAFSNKKEGKTC